MNTRARVEKARLYQWLVLPRMGYDAMGPGLAGATKEMVMFKASILSPTSAANAPVGSFLLAGGEWNICVDLGRKALLRLTGNIQSRLLFADGDTATYLTPSVEPGFDVEIPNLQGCFKIPDGNQIGAAMYYSERGMVLHGTTLPDENEYYFTLGGKHIQAAPGGLVPLFGWSPKVINKDGTGKLYLF